MTKEPSSPPCHAADADDGYMGFAERQEVLDALNELLGAERAGARVAMASVKSGGGEGEGEEFRNLMALVHKDEVHWCAMLTRHIRALGGTPSRTVGAFFGKAMAIPDPAERLVFLNRGQAWVVRKLEALTPRIRDDALHADLRAMAEKHRQNIEHIGHS